MKKLLASFIVVFLFAVSPIFAQEAAEDHLAFMGIPITGNVDSFAKNLAKKGFTKDANLSSDEYLLLTGKFTNREVVVMLEFSEKTNDIFRVFVVYESQTSWELLSNNYDYLVDLYSKKYGSPVKSVKELDSDYDDSHHIMGFHLEKSKYLTYWSLSNGFILISINALSEDSANVSIVYEDAARTQSLSNEFMDDI